MNKINIVQFLDCYERHPCLWNPREREYRNNYIRLAALKSIIEEIHLTISIEELKTKIKNIRTTYSREVSKIGESKKSGAGTDDIYKPQLTWFSTADRFLMAVVQGRTSKNNMIKGNENSTETTNSDSSFFDELDQDSHTEPAVKKKKFLSPKKRAQQTVPPVLEAVNKLEYLAKNIRQDEFDTFGQHVANQLRNLPLTNAIMCQNFISNYLSQERLKVLNSRHLPTSRPSSSTSEYTRDASTPFDLGENYFDNRQQEENIDIISQAFRSCVDDNIM